jgi:O-antigen/teichoic acid export membrane protein
MPEPEHTPPSVPRGTYLGLRADVATVVSTLLVSVVVARALGPTERGVYFLAVLTGTLIALVGDMGMSTAGVVFGANRRVDVREIHGTALGFSLSAGAVGVVLLQVFAPWLTDHVLKGLDRSMLLLVGLGVAPLLYAQILGAVLTGLGRIAEISLVRIGVAFLLIAVTTPAVVISGDAYWGVLAWVVTNVAYAAGVAVYLVRSGGLPRAPSPASARELMGFGLRGHVGTLAQHGVLRVDVLFVSARLGPRSVGIYSLASVMAERISLLGSAVYAATARRLGSDAREEAAALAARVVRALVVVMIPAAAVLAAVATPLITLVYGSAFSAAAAPFRLLLPGTVCLTLWSVVSLYVLSSLRRPGLTTLIQVGALLVALPCYWLAVRSHGMNGAAVVSSLLYAGLFVAGSAVLVLTSRIRPADLVPGRADLRTLMDLARAVRAPRVYARRA